MKNRFQAFWQPKKLSSYAEKFIHSLEICEEAVDYCEKAILKEIRQMASLSNNNDHTASIYTTFSELHLLLNNYTITPSLLELYHKRDVFLTIQAQLINQPSSHYQGILVRNIKNQPVQASTFGQYREMNGLKDLIFPSSPDLTAKVKNSIIRTSKKTARLKQQVNYSKNNVTSLTEDEIYSRFTNANDSLAPVNEQLAKHREIEKVEGWFVGTLRKLARIFSPVTCTAEKSNQLQLLFRNR